MPNDSSASSGIPPEELEAYHALQACTLTLGDATFVHQHVVDAWMAQHADEGTKPIGLTFALIGLCLHLERGWSGREVQLAHIELAREKHSWPSFRLPPERGTVTAADVMRAGAGPDRNEAIDVWCASVWGAFSAVRDDVIALLARHGILDGSIEPAQSRGGRRRRPTQPRRQK